MTVKSELDRQRLSYIAFKYDSGSGTFQGYDGSTWKIIDKVRYNVGVFEGWNGTSWVALPTAADLNTEITARLNADSTLQANLDAEITARTDTDSTLQANIDAEITARTDADSTLQTNLNTEITARLDADSTLQANIDAEITARLDADSTLQTNVDAEITARTDADSTLQTNLNTEITARLDADSTLQTNIDVETTARADTDSTLQANIDAEITARLDADSTLQTNVDAEITARTDADSTLQTNLNTEITARLDADSTLQSNIDAEVTARTDADSTINAVGIASGNGVTASGTIGGDDLSVELGALTADWDATGGNSFYISVATPSSPAHATTKAYVDQLAITGGVVREAVLLTEQLDNTDGINAAEVVFFNAEPAANDTVVIKNASVTETYTFVSGAEANPFEVSIGGTPATTMTNLAQAINDDSVAWDAKYAANGLDSINANGVVVVYEQASASGDSASRIYGTWATQANCQVVQYNGTVQYTTEKAAVQLPSSDPAAGRFGFRRQQTALINGEIHLALEQDVLQSWNDDATAWLSLSGSGSLPDATSGSGGDIKGKVTFDSDLGLEVNSGVAKVKVDTTTIDFDGTGQLNVVDYVSATSVNAEITARATADSTLQANINTEITARLDADSTLQSQIDALGGGGGLEIVATTAAAINTTTLADQRHYLINMAAATADILVHLPAIATKQNIKVEVYNNSSNGYRCAVDTTGAELIIYDGTGYDSVLIGPLESWIEFASNDTNWVAEDAVGGTVFATVGVVFKTTSYLAAAWDDIGADTTSAAFTITLPVSPVAGQTVRIRDVAGNAATNNITVARNGKNIAGASADFTIDLNWLDITFVYYNSTVGWAPVK